jgi:16S rRNA (cytosine967-C5)-methyltransferase
MRVDAATVSVADAAERLDATGQPFDRVLVDPPCSGLGTLQSRPDLRWRTSPERVIETAALQARILAAGAAAVRPGGTLVYSVCTISRAEGEEVAERFLARDGDFVPDPFEGCDPGTSHLQLLPHLDGTDGFFVARFRRR